MHVCVRAWITAVLTQHARSRIHRCATTVCAFAPERGGGAHGPRGMHSCIHSCGNTLKAIQRMKWLACTLDLLAFVYVCAHMRQVEHAERTQRLRRFAASAAHRVLLVSTTAGGQGLDMSAASVRLRARRNCL
jgi:hypothetical protein